MIVSTLNSRELYLTKFLGIWESKQHQNLPEAGGITILRFSILQQYYRHYNTEDLDVKFHRRKNLKFRIIQTGLKISKVQQVSNTTTFSAGDSKIQLQERCALKAHSKASNLLYFSFPEHNRNLHLFWNVRNFSTGPNKTDRSPYTLLKDRSVL